MIRSRVALVLALISFSSPLQAQRREPHTIAQGERARLYIPRGWRSAEVAIGVVGFVSPDSIALHVEGDRVLFATSATRGMRVDVSRGRGDPRRGAGFGALTGLVAGVLIGYVAGEDCGPQSFVCFDRSETVPAFALGGMVAGAVFGALMNTGERWERARMPAAPRASTRTGATTCGVTEGGETRCWEGSTGLPPDDYSRVRSLAKVTGASTAGSPKT